MAELRFGGSVWCNIDTALRNLDRLYTLAFEALELDVIEAYILRVLYQQDGQRPSDLAQAVGRAPTSFTPILDKLERKGLTERRPHEMDRRSVSIHLTQAGRKLEQSVTDSFRSVERRITNQLPPGQLEGFYNSLLALQQLSSNSTKSTNSTWLLEDAQPTSATTAATAKVNGKSERQKSTFG
jgi:DNA-binding MarR family transcriptional regulator